MVSHHLGVHLINYENDKSNMQFIEWHNFPVVPKQDHYTMTTHYSHWLYTPDNKIITGCFVHNLLT